MPRSLVVLLRGVNVGGHRTFRPKLLAERLKRLDVVSIGAVGTFVVREKATQADVRRAFARELPFDTHIVIVPGHDILRLVSGDPFSRQKASRNVTFFISVLLRTPPRGPVFPLILPPRGTWLMKILGREGRFVLGMYRRQMKAIGLLGSLDRLFGVPATARSWTTITAIAKVLAAEGNREHKGRSRHNIRETYANAERALARDVSGVFSQSQVRFNL